MDEVTWKSRRGDAIKRSWKRTAFNWQMRLCKRSYMQEFFLQLALLLLGAKLLGELASKLKLPAVMGELLAGVLLGPSLLQWVESTPPIKLLAEIGVVLLLFEVGYESDLVRLRKAGYKPFYTACVGVALPFIFGWGIATYVFAQPLLTALFWGSALTATSIGITVRVLGDLKKQQEPEAQIVLGAAVLDDILGVMVLALLYEFAEGGAISLGNAGNILFFITAFSLAAPFVARVIFRGLGQVAKGGETPGLLTAVMVGLVLFFAWIAYKMQVPELLGGFAAGVALSGQFFPSFLPLKADFAHSVEEKMRPIVHLFTPIFFANVGLSLDLSAINWGSGHVGALFLLTLVAAVIGKLGSGLLLPGENREVKWAVGIAMVPRGEVGLVFAEMGRESGVFSQELYAAMIGVIAATTLLTPFALRLFYARRLPAPTL
jgi:Kef-type K+ transport system membrane component KefB